MSASQIELQDELYREIKNCLAQKEFWFSDKGYQVSANASYQQRATTIRLLSLVQQAFALCVSAEQIRSWFDWSLEHFNIRYDLAVSFYSARRQGIILQLHAELPEFCDDDATLTALLASTAEKIVTNARV